MMSHHDKSLDRFKGLLICLIILGHNHFFSRYYQNSHALIYNFHVLCFLLFPFLFLTRKFDLRTLKGRLFRIAAPHGVFVLIAAMAFFVVYVLNGEQAAGEWGIKAIWALLLERETLLRQAFGAGFLWFLPAYAAMVLLLFVYLNASEFQRALFALVALAWHLVMGLFDQPLLYQLPFSFSLVSYVFVLGLMIHVIHTRVAWNTVLSLAVIAAWVIAAWLVIRFDFYHPLAGDFYHPPLSIAEPVQLLLQDGFIVLSFVALLRFCYLLKCVVLAYLGRYSLQLFLLHYFVWQTLWRGGLNGIEAQTTFSRLAITGLSFMATLLVTMAVIKLLERLKLHGVLFPRKLSDWGIAAK